MIRIMKANYFLIIFLFAIGCKQIDSINTDLNLDFEVIENGMPKGWEIYPQQTDYSVSLDSVNIYSGRYSIAIEYLKDSVFVPYQLIGRILLNNYGGEKITLSGYMKTENVIDGLAGLWLKITPDNTKTDMQRQGINGTTDWRKYEITLDMNPKLSKSIQIGGFFTGKGKMWIDDLKVTIDGKDIGTIKPYKLESFSEKEKNDKEFDNGSNILFPELSEQKINDLELLGRIWGFMKYHHPAIAKGKYNWDYELFRMLPDYLKANNHQKRDKILIKWIKKYGRVPKCKTCWATPDSAFLKPDLLWIEKSNTNQKLKDLLQNIYLNRNQRRHYYVDIMSGAGNPVFSNERAYVAMNESDAGFRLLALYRYWNMIHYFFPYKHLTDKDWNAVLKEYVSYFIEAENRLKYELTVARLIADICDTHATLYEVKKIMSLKGSKQVPAFVKFVENQLVVIEYFGADAELKKGDIITHIDRIPVEVIVDSMKKHYPASNEAVRTRWIANDILRTNKFQTLNINYISSEQKKQKEIFVITRDEWMSYYPKRGNAKSYKYINEDIGYITLETIKNEDIPTIRKEFENTKGIIIDIRNYPSDFVLYSLGSFFVSEDTPFSKGTIANPYHPGEFIFGGKSIISKSKYYYHGKIVVIVNEETQSLAEFTAMAFRAGDNTTIIGSQTSGADGNVSEIVLPGGLKTCISGIGIYYPDGRETQRIGIIPDIEVKPTIKGIREGRDELLEKAIEIIRQE